MARLPTIILIRPRPGTPTRGMCMGHRGRTKMRCRTHLSSRRMGRISSKVSISCARCAASIPACRAAYTCTLAKERHSKPSTRPHSASMLKTTEVERQTGRIEELVRKLESSADPDLLATAQELVRSLMELYGAGLERITEIVFAQGEAGRDILDQFGRDELVSNLLAANGLHPLDLEDRVRRALEGLQARIRSQGTVEMLGVEEGVIRLRARATGSG